MVQSKMPEEFTETKLIKKEGKKPIQLTTRQRIINIIGEAVMEEMETMGFLDLQGKFITENDYITGLLKEKAKKILRDPQLIGTELNGELSFPDKILQGHPVGGNLEMGGIKPEFRKAPDYVIDAEIILKVFTE